CAYTGVLAAAAVAVPMSTRSAPAELAYMLRHSGAVALLHGPTAKPPDAPVRLRWGPDTVAELPAAAPVAGPRAGDPAQSLDTSGTTGRPKGVTAVHANLTYGARLHPPLRPLAHSRQSLHAFPIGTNAAQTMLFNALTAHAGMLVTARFGADHFARLIQRYAVGSVFVVPTMAVELLRSGALQRYDVSSVVLFGSTAAALPPPAALGRAETLRRRQRGAVRLPRRRPAPGRGDRVGGGAAEGHDRQLLHLHRGGAGTVQHGLRPGPPGRAGQGGRRGHGAGVRRGRTTLPARGDRRGVAARRRRGPVLSRRPGRHPAGVPGRLDPHG